MDERAARLRRANEQQAWLEDPEAQAVSLRCECGREDCDDEVVVALGDFDRARDLDARLVSVGHADATGTRVLERHERFALVADDEG